MGTKNWKPEPAPARFGQIPASRGLVFICAHCARPTATTRDAVLKAYGERGVITEACKRIRCRWCKKRGMRAALTPGWAGLDFGSASDASKLAKAIAALKPRGTVS